MMSLGWWVTTPVEDKFEEKPVSKEERSNLMWKNRQGLVDPMWLSQEGCRQAGSDPTCCGESGRGYPWPTPLSHHCCCCLLRPLFPNLPTSLLWPTLHPKHNSWAVWCLLPITKNGRQLFGCTPFLRKVADNPASYFFIEKKLPAAFFWNNFG